MLEDTGVLLDVHSLGKDVQEDRNGLVTNSSLNLNIIIFRSCAVFFFSIGFNQT